VRPARMSSCRFRNAVRWRWVQAYLSRCMRFPSLRHAGGASLNAGRRTRGLAHAEGSVLAPSASWSRLDRAPSALHEPPRNAGTVAGAPRFPSGPNLTNGKLPRNNSTREARRKVAEANRSCGVRRRVPTPSRTKHRERSPRCSVVFVQLHGTRAAPPLHHSEMPWRARVFVTSSMTR
jgi:hypothetical protein